MLRLNLDFWRSLVLVGLLFTASAASRGDEVILQLKNGDRVSGFLFAEDATQLTLTNRLLGKVIIPLAEVKKRKTIKAKVPPPPLGRIASPVPAPPKTTNVATTATGTVTNAPAKPGTNAPPPTAVAAAPKPPSKPKVKRWTFDTQLGINLQYNQRATELYYGAFKALYSGVRFRDTFDIKGNYGRSDGLVTANNLRGTVRTEYDLSKTKKMFLFNEGGAGYDEIRRIDFTYDDSLGVGYKLLTLTNFVLNIDTGANYQAQRFEDGTSKNIFALRLGEKITWRISQKITLDELAEFYPRSVEVDNYRLRFESTLRFLISKYLTLNLTVADLYDTNPAPGVSPNDLQIRSTIGVRF